MLNRNNNKLFGETKAQGILEVVIAISVVIIGLVSIMSLVIFNINVQSYNHDMLIASNLAREGIEIIRNVRDSNWLDPEKDWDTSLFHEGSAPSSDENSFFIFNWASLELDNSSYGIYQIGMSWEDCINADYCRLYFVPILGGLNQEIYNYGYDLGGRLIANSRASNFYRMIYINEICYDAGREEILENYGERCTEPSEKIGMQVIVKVGWESKGSIKIIEAEERLYNWK